LDIFEFFEHEGFGEPHVVASDDVKYWLPDVMPFEYACTIMGRPPLRTIAFGNNNNVTDASMQLGMKSILLAGNTPR